MKIKYPQNELARFRRRAVKKYPKEYGELLYGQILAGKPVIRAFVSGPYLASAGHWIPTKVEPAHGNYAFLGANHSHPGVNDCSPSENDWEWAKDAAMAVQAICVVREPGLKPRTRTQFFLGNALLKS